MKKPIYKTIRHIWRNMNGGENQDIYYNDQKIKRVHPMGDKKFMGIFMEDGTHFIVGYKTKLEIR